MRIDRIRLKNFGGVTDSEVKISPTGVTVIHGANEAGKSSLMQGINILFDYRDDSKAEDVRVTKPVNRDVGSEVEVDVNVGPCRFTYFKRFHKDRETRLTIHAPKAESLVGREAHDRVQEILSGSVDIGLWRALRIVQGGSLAMPELNSQPALAQALDRVAGQAKSGENEEALFEAAGVEHRLYFTPSGKEKEDPVGRARARADATAAAARGCLAQLKAVEDDVVRFAALERSVLSQKRGISALEAAWQKDQASWDIVSKLAGEVESAKVAHQLASQAFQVATSAIRERNELVSLSQAAASGLESTAEKNAKTSASLVDATATFGSAKVARDVAATTSSECDSEERLRRADHDFRNEEFELVRLRERLEHVQKADTAAAAAGGILATTKITDALRKSIRSAELGLTTAQGILNSASPQFGITALTTVSVEINGKRETLGVGEKRVVPVSEAICASIGDSVQLRVEPGTSAGDLRQRVVEAENALAKACAKAGVNNPEEAEAALAALKEAKRIVEDRDRIAKEHLRDLTREALGECVAKANAKVQAYQAKRASVPAMPKSPDEARTLLEAAGAAAANARSALQRAEAVYSQVLEHHAKCREDHAAVAALLEQAKKDCGLSTGRLAVARNVCADAELERSGAETDARAKVALENLRGAEGSLGKADPESAKVSLATAEAAVQKGREAFAEQNNELIRLRTKLDLQGDQGLAESLYEAERAAFEANDSLDRLLRRAAAADLLYETLRAEQDAMRRAYVEPLREGIERLGRPVFGPTLKVDVNETLQVVSRTVNGVTVPLGQLSTGAREQMGLLVRLAVARMVSKEGGVPLVLDDALGSSDEVRLEAMGAVLRMASQDIQTIILTCAPDRYLHAGAQVSCEIA